MNLPPHIQNNNFEFNSNHANTSSNQRPLKLTIINCQSIQAKKPTFENFINQHDPDFIAGSESWLTPSVHTSEIFPSSYTVYRRDRPDGYGGVFLGCKSMFVCEEINLSTICEIIACRVHLDNHSLILISVYRPPDKNYAYLEELCSTIRSIILSNPNDIIWLAGDINFPNINWNTYHVKGNNYPISLCKMFIETILEHGLFQLVYSPTRNENILDIFTSNHPSLVSECNTIPGISDHEAVLVLSYISAKTQQPFSRKIFQWHKANFTHIKELIQRFRADFNYNSCLIVEMYEQLSFTIHVINLSDSLLFLFRVALISLPSGLFTRISVTL